MERDSAKMTQRIGPKGEFSHHAYCLSGERDVILPELIRSLEKEFKCKTQGNPDFSLYQFNVLSVDDSRQIKEMFQTKPFGEKRVAILAFNSATSEAQSALLKILEEPARDSHLFLLVPSAGFLLQTVRSRVALIQFGNDEQKKALSQAKEFLTSSIPERLVISKSIAEAVSEEEMDKQFVIDVVGQLEALYAKERSKSDIPLSVFEDISLCRKYLADRSASVKMLLEHLSLVLPPLKM